MKRVLLFFGVVVLLGAVGLLAKNLIDLNQLVAVASANRSTGFFHPGREVLLTAGLALLSGLLLGLGIALHTRPAHEPRAHPPQSNRPPDLN
nr:hypothetical protein [Deinococcus aestuarii]